MIDIKEHEKIIQLLLNTIEKIKAHHQNNKVKSQQTPTQMANDLKKQYRKMIQKKLLDNTN